jgi:hypothetical protein
VIAQGPSDYTRIIAGPGVTSTSPSLAPPTPLPTEQKRPGRRRLVVLIVVLAVALVTVMTLVLYFALRTPPAAPGG